MAVSSAVLNTTIEQIGKGEISSKNRITPGKLNEVFDFLGIKFKVESEMRGKQRIYTLINPKGKKMEFRSMGSLIFDTPVKGAIELKAGSMDSPNEFFADLMEEQKNGNGGKKGRRSK